MYTYIMTRTQIYLSDEIGATLDRLARQTGRTKSHLIRVALEQVYLGGCRQDDVLRALRGSAGAWQRRESGASYVERARSGRLARIHR